MNAELYILGDADRIREQIELQLLAGRLNEVRAFSVKLTSGLANLARAAEELLSAETIMLGGDDVLFRVASHAYSLKVLEEIAEKFNEETGCTISFGVANDVAIAYLNLRRAKAAGGGTIVAPEARL